MIIVVKIGGAAAEDGKLVKLLAEEISALTEENYKVLLVHGGGITISTLQKQLGITPRFNNGIRETLPQEMPVIDMALAGEVNKRIVRQMRSAGVNAFGLSGADGGIITAESAGGSVETNRTGKVVSTDVYPLKHLWSGGFTPVIAPPSSDSTGNAFNINADEAALALAEALKAAFLIFISDVPGVLDNGKVIDKLTPSLIKEHIDSGVINGGMIPKVRSAAAALEKGVGSVCISNYSEDGALKKILSGKQGTVIKKS